MRRHRDLQVGQFQLIYDPSKDAGVPTYINDHTIVRGNDGLYHLFGITHAEPADPENEKSFAHAVAEDLHGPWRTLPPALVADPAYGEKHLWAPHVIEHLGQFWMFYAAGGDTPVQAAINLATSPDLQTWTRHPGGPLFRDGFEARDPMVVWTGVGWTMYYCATDDPNGGHHVVAYRTSLDLVNWSDRQIAFTSALTGTGAGDTESPFVTEHNGNWYLFCGPCGAYDDRPDGYVCTSVYRSADPHRFDRKNRVLRFPSHAAEVIENQWVTHCGWGQGGVFLAPLQWD